MAGSLALNVEILGEFKNLTKATQGAESSLSKLNDKVNRVSSGIGKAIGGIAIALGFTGIVSGLRDAVAAAEEAKVANDRIDAIAKSMDLFGNETKKTTDRIKEFAESQELLLGVEAEVLKATQAKLLTFAEVAKTADVMGGAFDRATVLAADLAAAGFGEATANATQLGKALNDPIAGISALTRVGLTFTDAQKGLIEALMATGDVAGAQNIILAELERQVGGTAAATATDSEKMRLALERVSEEIGTALLPLLNEFTTWLTSPEGQETLDQVIEGVTEIITGLASLAQWVIDNKDWLVPMVAAIATVTAAWKVATTAVGLYKAAALLTGGASAVGAVTGGAAAAGAAAGGITVGSVALPLVGGAAVGAYYGSDAKQDLRAALDAAEKGEPYEKPWERNGVDINPRDNVTQNVTINVNNGNVTATEIAGKINKAIKTTGTNVIGLRY